MTKPHHLRLVPAPRCHCGGQHPREAHTDALVALEQVQAALTKNRDAEAFRWLLVAKKLVSGGRRGG